ncbi:putative vacuolar protein sorting-associated protein [Lachnellula hyalina]|uniref:Putative vacuolar protein sorting-associated protein n=1 Tax=Lachnellula hyalina TaxID=1316788 RepID=A0A8H8R1G5_9HELO|nr:putative vacuolar protein sorting-associated protein [Lachnellula hyalina]TVY25680.1 putative vacuolar protein sorting-associated protein [Lachnellula hyalina]
MDIHEKEPLVELEKGESPRAVRSRERWMPWTDTGLAIFYKIILSVAAILLLGYNFCCTTRPRLVATQVEGVPQFVLDYAPLTYLDTAEAYFPSDISAQITYTHPAINGSSMHEDEDEIPTLNTTNLHILNKYGENGTNIYLTSNSDITSSPSWLTGVVPNSTTGKTSNAISCAIIIYPKPSLSVTDVFYFYFYAYNQGNTVFGRELGDHIGDWEHNMIRFQDGVPQAMWFSQHNNGQAFTYPSLEKLHSGPGRGKRPINYSARGSHANYATTGKHDHTIPDLNLPNGFIIDYTSEGALWDPVLNAYFYNYNGSTNTFEGINGAPEGAMHYRGHWGDEQYPIEDPRQPDSFFGFVKYVSGPTGPQDKYLERGDVCPGNGIPCFVRDRLGP